MQAVRGTGLLPEDADGCAGPRQLVHRAHGGRLKVVFVNRFFHPDLSGTAQMLGDLAFFLAARGYDITVITSRQLYDDPDAQLPASENVKGVRIRRVATSRFGRSKLTGRALDYLTFYVRAAFALWQSAQPGVTVVAMTDPPLVSVPAALVCGLRNSRLVNWMQDVFPEVAEAAGARFAGGMTGRLLAWLRDLSLRRAQCTVVLGERMAALVLARGVAGERLKVIPNWADGQGIRPVERDANPLLEQWGLRDCFVVAYSGNMGRVHEFETIVGAARLLRDDPGIRFVFIGDGHWRPWIEAQSRDAGLSTVLFKPYQPREALSLSLGVGDVHLVSLLPRMEGFVVPSKLYGIAAAARPTLFIGDPEGEIARLLARHDIGATVPPGDAQGLAKMVLELKADGARRREMGTRARAVFEIAYDRPVAMAKWQTVLSDIDSVPGWG